MASDSVSTFNTEVGIGIVIETLKNRPAVKFVEDKNLGGGNEKVILVRCVK